MSRSTKFLNIQKEKLIPQKEETRVYCQQGSQPLHCLTHWDCRDIAAQEHSRADTQGQADTHHITTQQQLLKSHGLQLWGGKKKFSPPLGKEGRIVFCTGAAAARTWWEAGRQLYKLARKQKQEAQMMLTGLKCNDSRAHSVLLHPLLNTLGDKEPNG